MSAQLNSRGLDPLVLIDQLASQGRAAQTVARKVRSRLAFLTGAVERVEKASNLHYPPYYVEPTLPVATTRVEFGSAGVLYARVIPTKTENGLVIVVQFTAPLVAFGSKGTIEAVAAHEFTHYVDLVRRLSTMGVVSDELASSLFESAYSDPERTVDPNIILSDKALTRLLSRKFKDGLVDEKLNEKVTKNWLEKGLPTRRVAPEDNTVRVSVESILSARFDPMVVERIRNLGGRKK